VRQHAAPELIAIESPSQMSITQAATRTVIAAAQAHARELGLRVTVAVVDTGGLLMGLDRMDGAPPLSAQIAEAKAQGAAVWHRDGHAIAEVAQERPAFVSAISQMTRLPLIAGAGSLVIRDGDGNVLGAVGVSGAKPDEDRACAEAGIAGLGG
jgi:glc operon protein GlcG